MELSIVVAVSANHVIGSGGALPWALPEDLRHFRRLTMGKPVVMGRRTRDSIGRPLTGRRNIVISSGPDPRIPGFEHAASPEAALDLVSDVEEAMIIGGAGVYASFLPRADRIYLTRIHASVSGDTFFPALAPEEWKLHASEHHPATARQPLAYSFETLLRARGAPAGDAGTAATRSWP